MTRVPTLLLLATLAIAACQPTAPTAATPSASSVPSAAPVVTPAPTATEAPPVPTPTPSVAASAIAVAPSPSAPARLRTYGTTIKPITSSQNCKTCHATGPGVSHEFDASRKATIVRMAETNGPRVGLTSQQIADVRAWFDAGAPNDPTPF